MYNVEVYFLLCKNIAHMSHWRKLYGNLKLDLWFFRHCIFSLFCYYLLFGGHDHSLEENCPFANKCFVPCLVGIISMVPEWILKVFYIVLQFCFPLSTIRTWSWRFFKLTIYSFYLAFIVPLFKQACFFHPRMLYTN